jgi:hypothetical protein
MVEMILKESPRIIISPIQYVFNLTAGNMANTIAHQRTNLKVKKTRRGS